MSTIYMLIGVPGSGKSTYVNNHQWTKDCDYISSDHYIEEYAKKVGKTYSEVFADYIQTAIQLMNADAEKAKQAGHDIIWDQTNTSAKARANRLRMFPDYYKVAIVFPTPEPEELERRLASRPGKTIPPDIIKSMIANLQLPTEDEGFDRVINV
jgi:heterogeneous nuclear ribonucleoprotein U-like protein 1